MHFGLFSGEVLTTRKRRFSLFLTVTAVQARQLRRAPPCGVATETFLSSASEPGQGHLFVVDRPLPRPSADEPDAGLLHERTDARQKRVRLRGHGPEIVGKELQDLLEALRLAEKLRRVDVREDAQREDVLQPLERPHSRLLQRELLLHHEERRLDLPAVAVGLSRAFGVDGHLRGALEDPVRADDVEVDRLLVEAAFDDEDADVLRHRVL